MGYILKNKQKNECVSTREITRLIIMKMKMKMKNKSHRYDIDLGLDTDKNIVNIERVSLRRCLCVLSNL